ncbi:zinc finger, CCHC-type containing protein [Tanacetum coccineum]|uniref:Zinc finger, CCHC-type containing protein n=1 Tax=Tanacetum coccineum TaxID=301880 RepID=A0ABQ5G9H2_9ASTR
MAATTMKYMASNFSKLDKFKGVDFQRWQKKIHFLLSNMSVVYLLTTPMPEDQGDNPTVEQDSLKAKYMAEDASSKKFLVSCIIEKLPFSWKDFKHTLKHLKEELTLFELGSHLRIEESLRAQDSDKPKDSNVVGPQLGHVHFKRMQDMSKDGLIPAFDIDTKKCKTCMLTKITKKPFQNVKRETEVLELIHSDLYDLHATPSLGNKKYFVTFIDDASRAVVRLPDPKLKTLGERRTECIFVGYVEHSKAFRFCVIEPNDSVAINLIIESRNAIFDENRFSSVPRPSLRISIGTEDIGGSVVPKKVTEEDDPKTFDDAIKSQDVIFWKEAINDEIDSIMGNNTWVLADLPPDCKPLGCKWIFKRKLKVDGTIKKFKARLVIQGFKQKSGIDYFDTYALVARISTIRLLIAMASIHNLIIHQMDIKIAFLNGELEEEVYMNQRQGFIMPSNENKKVLKKFNYFGCTPVSTPMDTSEKLMPNNGQAVSQLEYSRVIGCLMYAMTCIRPDIAFDVGKLSRLTYIGYPSILEGYTYASWISNTEDNSSTSGWVFLLGGGAISWASKKQTCITSSTMKYEFVALAVVGALKVIDSVSRDVVAWPSLKL